MESILVISDEPALAETLISELPELTITAVRPKDVHAALALPHALVLADSASLSAETMQLLKTKEVSLVTLSRPLRLSALLYTIHEQLARKTAPAREEHILSVECIFIPGERALTGAATVALTEKETELLLYLIKHSEAPCPREAMLKDIWGYVEDVLTHTLETHMYRLRGKLREADEHIDIISSEAGYQLSKAAPD